MTEGGAKKPWPEEVRLDLDAAQLRVTYDNGEVFLLDAEYLRVFSPSAEVRGHGAKEKPKPVSGKRDVKIIDIKAIGNYAVRLIFDDGHETGLFSWDYLYELGSDRYKLWPEYQERLAREGLSRDPPDAGPDAPVVPFGR